MNPYISILIADTDQEDAAFLNEGISKVISAYKVFNATDGAQCLRFLKNNEAPELIFLDQDMPLKNGLECLKAIKQNAALDGTHVIMYSSSHNLKDIDQAYKLGAMFYMVKPVLLSSLVKMLQQIFVTIGKPKTAVRDKNAFVLMERMITNNIGLANSAPGFARR